MTVKQWFARGRNLDKRINTLLQQREDEFARLTQMTTDLAGIRVSGTKDPHRFDGYIQLSEQIDTEIDALYKIKAEIKGVIIQIPNPIYRDLLDMRYIQNMTWERIAVEMNYSFEYVRGILHGRALQEAGKLLQNIS